MSHPPFANPPGLANPAVPDADQVVAFLAAHPRFLADHPALYDTLEPPTRVHGDRLADHMAAMLTAARNGRQAVAAERGRARSLEERVRAAVLALMEQPDPRATVTEDWPRLLGLEVCALRSEAPTQPRPLPPGSVARLLPPGRNLVLRDAGPKLDPELGPLFGPGSGPGSIALHGEAAPLVVREALLRLALPVPSLLALGARSPGALPLRGGSAALLFLAAALTAALGR